METDVRADIKTPYMNPTRDKLSKWNRQINPLYRDDFNNNEIPRLFFKFHEQLYLKIG